MGRSKGGGEKKRKNANVDLTNPALSSSAFQQKSLDVTLSDHDITRPNPTTERLWETFRRQLTEPVYLSDTDWHLGSMDLWIAGSWQHVGSKYVIVGDTKHTLQEIEILLGLVSSNPEQLFLLLRCVCPPLFLPKGQIIAQVIPAPDMFLERDIARNRRPEVCSTQAIGRDKLKIWCEVCCGGEVINIKGLLDTGAHVTVIPKWMWPSHWELQNVAGHVEGFEHQEKKIQRMLPWKCLGLEIGMRTIVPQKLTVKNNIKNLADVQQLCGSLNWRSGYGIYSGSVEIME
ncbi:hypothetical protein DUI87_12968 [Hirundo rustica rustica]|uniref:Peptidase A2 domain-containing protein n=1 Tax=Hirundo rustica rustica TaxID=333673 RepID=A0A3M0KAF7_HIRRU|nr:hypothetical protein DUI87_12968 [Hirundo rustica rustica]